MRLDRLYILAGFAWLAFGMAYGIYLGITDQLNLGNSHAHANLVGFVLSCLFGLLHRNWPALAAHPLARVQFWVYQCGAVILVTGKYIVDTGGTPATAATGSLVVLLGTLMMIWLFATQSDGKHVSRSAEASGA